MGVKTKGSLLPEFEQVAWGLSASTDQGLDIGEARTEEGYHLIIVTKRL